MKLTASKVATMGSVMERGCSPGCAMVLYPPSLETKSVRQSCQTARRLAQLEGVESSIRSSHLTANDIIYADNGEKLALWERNYMMSHNKLIGGVFLMQERGTRNDERSCTGRFSLFCALSCWHSHPPSCSCARLVLTSSIRPQTLPATARTRMLRTSDQSTNPSWMRVSRCG